MKNKRMRLLCLLFVFTLVVSGCGSNTSVASTDAANQDARKVYDMLTSDKEKDGKKEQKEEKIRSGGDDHIYVESSVNEGKSSWDGTTKKSTYEGNGFTVSFILSNSWDGGFQADIEIKNTGDKAINNWGLEFDYDGTFSDCWNAGKSKEGEKYTFKALEWNAQIDPGQNVSFGMIGSESFKGFPQSYVLYEYGASAPVATVNPGTATQAPAATTSPSDDGSGDTVGEDGDDEVTGEIVSGTVKKHGRLKVKGRYIVDKKGKKFLIKGPSTHGIAWFPEFVNKSAFKSFKKWGANTVRLACYSSEGEGYNTDSVWKTIDRGVKAASELGMYVIIDWHILNENKPMMSYDRAKVFFKYFAQKYGKRKNVIWEICNEPNGCEWAADIKPYAKKIIPLIRKYSKNIIVVGTPTWSQDVDVVANDRLTGKYKKNVCYTFHFYAATHKDDLRNRVKTAISKGLPILCTEFSICEASGAGTLDKASGNAWIKLFKKNGIGYVSWSLCNKDEAASLLLPSCQKTGNFKKSDLSPTGKWVIKKW